MQNTFYYSNPFIWWFLPNHCPLLFSLYPYKWPATIWCQPHFVNDWSFACALGGFYQRPSFSCGVNFEVKRWPEVTSVSGTSPNSVISARVEWSGDPWAKGPRGMKTFGVAQRPHILLNLDLSKLWAQFVCFAARKGLFHFSILFIEVEGHAMLPINSLDYMDLSEHTMDEQMNRNSQSASRTPS